MSPVAPTSHRISSPPPPEIFNKAISAYHSYNLEQAGGTVPVDFLTFWYGEDRLEAPDISTSLLASTGLEEILQGIITLRDQAVSESIRGSISTGATIHILESIKRAAIFEESTIYWSDFVRVIEMEKRRVIPLKDLAEIVTSFLISQQVESQDHTDDDEFFYTEKSSLCALSSETTTALGSPSSAATVTLPIQSRRDSLPSRRWCSADFMDCPVQ